MAPAGLKQTGYVIPNCLRGNGGFLSSVRELGQWARALDTTNIASAATKARAAEAVIATGRRPNEKMGYGWFVTETPQGRMVSHSGGNGIFATNLRRYVDHDVVVVMSTNNFRHNWDWAERDVIALLFGDAVPMPPEARATVDPARVAGRYRLPSGRELELRVERGQLVLDPFAAPEVTSLARPKNVQTDERAKALLADAKRGFEEIAAGKPELLAKGLIPNVTAEEEREFWAGWVKETVERRGKFVAATPLWAVPSDDRLYAYVLMQFEKGSEVVRWEQRPNGVFAHAFPPRQFPEVYRFVAQSPEEWMTWNPHLGVGMALRLEGDAIVLGGMRAKRVGAG